MKRQMIKNILLILILGLVSCCEDLSDQCLCLKNDQHPIYRACISIREYNDAVQCSTNSLLEQVYASIKYPEQARIDSIEGRVVIAFDILSDGSIDNFTTVSDTIGYGLAQAAIEGAKTLNDIGFCPARESCNPIVYNFVLPVSFKLF